MNLLRRTANFPRRALWRARISRWGIGYPDPELRYVSRLCNGGKISIDVGASLGLYTAHLLSCSSAVWAIEPRKRAVTELKTIYHRSPVVVHPFALSDIDGELVLRVCGSDPGRSTLEPSNSINGEPETVIVKRLDTLNPKSVGFIKIDVEGHEEAVLKGAINTIERERPNLLIEIEERHKPGATKKVPELLAALGYTGWFLIENRWQQLSAFDVQEHQRENAVPYINNFVFVPAERKNLLA
jgi:FkbM family methyltransferase